MDLSATRVIWRLWRSEMGPEGPTLLWSGATFCQQVGKCLLLGKLRSLCGAQRAKVGWWTCNCCLFLGKHCPCSPRAIAACGGPAALGQCWIQPRASCRLSWLSPGVRWLGSWGVPCPLLSLLPTDSANAPIKFRDKVIGKWWYLLLKRSSDLD